MKILELSPLLFARREKMWMTKLTEFKNISYTSFDGDVGDFESQWPQISREYDLILLTESYHDFAFKKIQNIPTLLLSTGMADSLVKNASGDWVAHCFLRAAMLRAIGTIAPHLDTNGVACLSGFGDMMKCSVAVLNQIGFSKFRIINDDEINSDEIQREFQIYFFNLEIKFILTRDLTIEENSGVVLVNTVSGEQNADLLESLSYLNFIHKGGLVVDFDCSSYDSQLTKESFRVGLNTLRGVELRGFSDYYLLSSQLGNLSLTPAQYLSEWSELFKNQS